MVDGQWMPSRSGKMHLAVTMSGKFQSRCVSHTVLKDKTAKNTDDRCRLCLNIEKYGEPWPMPSTLTSTSAASQPPPDGRRWCYGTPK